MKIKKMTDEKCLEIFLELLNDRISIETGFIKDEANDNITHQVLQITCGEYVTLSQPEQLGVVLRPATGAEIGATVN